MWYVETEYGLPADASERERRAHFAGLKRSEIRAAATQNAASKKPKQKEGDASLCQPKDAERNALELAQEVATTLWG